MTIRHDSFTIERLIAACPAHVFSAWSDPAKKRRWFSNEADPHFQTANYRLDFRVGGREHGRFVIAGDHPAAGEHVNETTYLQIVADQLIVYAYSMAVNGRVHSASLATVEFADHGGGTRLRYTEQGTWIGQSDGPEGRQNGVGSLLDAMIEFLQPEIAQ